MTSDQMEDCAAAGYGDAHIGSISVIGITKLTGLGSEIQLRSGPIFL